ncbi:colicin immunity domain-containing protein [Pseudomonas protegens]|uniref:colicin immunity domain-containing protein n=1 Tax=Pseudomonas protegens TaxID=380021 RepID=UPI0032EDD74D
MVGPCIEYKFIIQRYLNDELSSLEFQALYIYKFKNEGRLLDENLFLLLDELFGDVDAYTEDESLLIESPGLYLSRQGLIEKAQNIFSRLVC